MNSQIVIITAAFFSDIVLGDPYWLPHPVRAIGWCINTSEPYFRKIFINEKIAGVFFTICITGTAWGLTFFIIKLFNMINVYAGYAASIFFIYTSFAVKSLKNESIKVYNALKQNDLIAARKNLGMIVGRDTQNISEKEIIRGTIETIAENTVDGIISPMIFAFIGGAPLAIAFKAVSTLDSMIGYKNSKYINFGWAAARLDDIANFIPARICAIIMPIAGMLSGNNPFRSLAIVLRDGKNSPSPNSGIPEAAVAGALQIQLGGLNFYNGVPTAKPYIGNNSRSMEIKDIKRSIAISYLSSILLLLLYILYKL